MTKHLHKPPRKPARSQAKRRPKASAWSPERPSGGTHPRLEALEKVDRPRTDAGKARSAANALKHGFRGRAFIERIREERQLVLDARAIIALAKTILRTVEARSMRIPHITVWTGDPELDGRPAPGASGGGPP